MPRQPGKRINWIMIGGVLLSLVVILGVLALLVVQYALAGV